MRATVSTGGFRFYLSFLQFSLLNLSCLMRDLVVIASSACGGESWSNEVLRTPAQLSSQQNQPSHRGLVQLASQTYNNRLPVAELAQCPSSKVSCQSLGVGGEGQRLCIQDLAGLLAYSEPGEKGSEKHAPNMCRAILAKGIDGIAPNN